LRTGATFSQLTFSDRKNGAIILDQGNAIAVLLGMKAADLKPDHVVFGSPDLADDLQKIIQTSLQGTQIPGASVAVINPDGTIWVGTEGVSNLRTGTSVAVGDRFNIGSTTKAIVATTVLQLVEEGKLSLNDTLDEHIPDISNQLPNGSQITLRELLNHTSGLPDVDTIIREQTLNSTVFRAKIIQDTQIPKSVRRLLRSLKNQPVSVESFVSNPIITQLSSTDFNYLVKTLTANSSVARTQTPPEQLIALAYDQQPLSSPGQDYQYNNINYLLLGEVVEAVTHSTLAEQMRTRIFEPLGMNHTFYPPQEKQMHNLARGYEDFNGDGKADDVLQYLDPSQFGFANGGIYSTAADLARFAQGLFKGELLAPTTLKTMLSNGNQDDEVFNYGLGMLYGNVPGIGEVWQHGGDNDGWHTRMFYLPDRDITAVVVENGDDINQRRNSGNPAAPTLLIDNLIQQIIQRVAS
jgi:CubicO group peptidase (beta-lactamase class C family)